MCFLFFRLLGIITFAFSLIMLVSGLVLVYVGNKLRTNAFYILTELLEKLRQIAEREVKKLPELFPRSYLDVDYPITDALSIINYISQLLMVVGGFFLVLAIYGCCLSRRSERCAVLVYVVLVGFLVLNWLALFQIVQDLLIKNMYASLQTYSGLTDFTPPGIIWNVLMFGFKCCGVRSYKDLQKLENWPPEALKSFTITKDQMVSAGIYDDRLPLTRENVRRVGCDFAPGSKKTIVCPLFDISKFKTPIACCKSPLMLFKGCHLKGTMNSTNNWGEVGCYTRVLDFITSHNDVIAVYTLISLVLISYLGVLLVRLCYGKEAEIDNRAMFSKPPPPPEMSQKKRAQSRKSVRFMESAISLKSVMSGKSPKSGKSSRSQETSNVRSERENSDFTQASPQTSSDVTGDSFSY